MLNSAWNAYRQSSLFMEIKIIISVKFAIRSFDRSVWIQDLRAEFSTDSIMTLPCPSAVLVSDRNITSVRFESNGAAHGTLSRYVHSPESRPRSCRSQGGSFDVCIPDYPLSCHRPFSGHCKTTSDVYWSGIRNTLSSFIIVDWNLTSAKNSFWSESYIKTVQIVSISDDWRFSKIFSRYPGSKRKSNCCLRSFQTKLPEIQDGCAHQ